MNVIRRTLRLTLLAFLATIVIIPSCNAQLSEKTEQLIQSLKAAEEVRERAIESLKARRIELQEELVKIDQALGQVTPKPPDPKPGPPTPDPIPPTPSPLSEVALRVKALVEKDVPLYEGRTKTKESVVFAYENAAKKIALAQVTQPITEDLKPYTTVDGIIAATGGEVVKALGQHVNHWRLFFVNLREYLSELATQGKLTTPASHEQVWKDIAAGLKAAN